MQLTELQTSIEKLQDFNTKSMKPLQAELKEIKAKTSRNIDHFRRLAENQKVYKFSIEAHQADIQELQEHLSHFEASIHQFDADSGKLASLETELKGLLVKKC